MAAPKSRRRTGTQIAPAKAAKILELLCQGETKEHIANLTHTHWLTVRQIEWKNRSTVEQRKLLLAERSEAAAVDALDLLHNKLRTGGSKLTPNALVPIFGVLVDKSLALRADPTIYVQHQHQHIHAHINETTYDQLLAALPKKSNLPAPTAGDDAADAAALPAAAAAPVTIDAATSLGSLEPIHQ